jgi:DNA-binding MarR family transcriptional regulator
VPADARAWTLAVTPRGHEVLEQIRQENTLLLADSLLTLSTEQLAALAAALPALERLADGTPQHPEAATADGPGAAG